MVAVEGRGVEKMLERFVSVETNELEVMLVKAFNAPVGTEETAEDGTPVK